MILTLRRDLVWSQKDGRMDTESDEEGELERRLLEESWSI